MCLTTSERALAFEVLQFADVLRTTANELGPNRLCDYIKDLSVRATEFITKCQVNFFLSEMKHGCINNHH